MYILSSCSSTNHTYLAYDLEYNYYTQDNKKNRGDTLMQSADIK